MNLVRSAALMLLVVTPVAGFSQDYHQRAVAAQHRHDHRHHTGAKIIGGSAVGGAVIGGLAGGGKGALIGGAVGAGGGALANRARVHHAVKQRERNGQ
jgi:outer membrane lipoprotein SlyB